jgi:hypothetical protein
MIQKERFIIIWKSKKCKSPKNYSWCVERASDGFRTGVLIPKEIEVMAGDYVVLAKMSTKYRFVYKEEGFHEYYRNLYKDVICE